MTKLTDYEIRPLSAVEGGGFLISNPDFADCISDGETIEEAVDNGTEVLQAMIATLKAAGLQVPAPNGGGVAPEDSSPGSRRPFTRNSRLAQGPKAYR